MEILGYAVEKVEDGRTGLLPAQGTLAYFLTGKRGATYGLIRYKTRPHLMFVVRGSNGSICGLKGNYTFSDEGGQLRVA